MHFEAVPEGQGAPHARFPTRRRARYPMRPSKSVLAGSFALIGGTQCLEVRTLPPRSLAITKQPACENGSAWDPAWAEASPPSTQNSEFPLAECRGDWRRPHGHEKVGGDYVWREVGVEDFLKSGSQSGLFWHLSHLIKKRGRNVSMCPMRTRRRTPGSGTGTLGTVHLSLYCKITTRSLHSAESSRVGQGLWSRYGLINIIYEYFKIKYL